MLLKAMSMMHLYISKHNNIQIQKNPNPEIHEKPRRVQIQKNRESKDPEKPKRSRSKKDQNLNPEKTVTKIQDP